MQHGTRANYLAGKCWCEPCTLANRTYARDYFREGKARSTPSWPVYQHLLALLDSGWTLQEIADRSGYTYATVHAIAGGRRRRVRCTTATDLLSLRAREAAA